MNSASTGTRAGLEIGILKQKAAANKVQAIFGKVTSNRARRPNVSIVGTAGQAKLCGVSDSAEVRATLEVTCMKFINPKPQEKNRADLGLASASVKRVAE